MPYHYHRTSVQLRALRDLFVDEISLSRCARLRRLARSTVQVLRAQFEKAVGVLRLPGQEGGLEPKPFLSRLFRFGANAIAEIFRDWKQTEPKHCVLGCYVR